MLQSLPRVPDDPILGISAAFRRDGTPLKVDLGVGVYKDESGATPVLSSVRKAEAQVLAAQTSKTYLSPVGNAGFNGAMLDLVLGADHAGRKGQAIAVQGPGGSGALRLGAELIRLANPAATVHVSDPTWANHLPLIGGAGLKVDKYPYYDAAAHRVRVDAMLGHLDALPAGAVVLLHGSCHNPTGQDLGDGDWQSIGQVLQRRNLVPFVDLAYLGFGGSLDQDAAPVRMLARLVPEMLVAVSCSKNFGLYRERTGALLVLAADGNQADICAGQLGRVARTLYSMPPDHGAAIVDRILGDAALRTEWAGEVAAMNARMRELRGLLARELGARLSGIDFDWMPRQRGMFSRLDLDPGQVVRLREQHHVYVAPDGRVNVAGISPKNVAHVADSIAAVTRG
ncbi:MAG: amino acid aminotransferase [Steroidobacteraceae bacterium]